MYYIMPVRYQNSKGRTIMPTHRPKAFFEAPDGGSSPVEAAIQSDGRIRMQTDPFSGHINGTWFTPRELREYATDLLALADTSEEVYGTEEDNEETRRYLEAVDIANGR